MWGDRPVGVADNPYEYRYSFPCEIENEGVADGYDIDCLAGLPECDAGEDGRVVFWEWRLRDFLETPEPNGDAPPNEGWTRDTDYGCIYSENPRDVLAEIGAIIEREFQQLPVSAGNVTLQPSPHTLRGAHTNVYAESVEQAFDIELLGQQVHIVARPVEYQWSYGDGTSMGPTTTAGGPLPRERWGEETRTSHVYAETGDYSVVLTTYFQGTYSVNGGPALPIPGSGEFFTAPQTISVWRSVTNNYADNCIENPAGLGC